MAEPRTRQQAAPGSVWWLMVATGEVDFLRVEDTVDVPESLATHPERPYWIHAETCTVDLHGKRDRVRKITLSPWQLDRYDLGGVWPVGDTVPTDAHGRARIVDSIVALAAACPTPKDLSRTHICLHCLGAMSDYYMVTDGLWVRVRDELYIRAEREHGERVAVLGGNFRGHLHIACVEALAGRTLKITDFPPVRCNDGIRWALRR